MILRRFSAALFLCLFPVLPLHAGAEGDPNGEAPQAARTVALPLGSVDAVSGALTMKVPLGPRLPGRIPLGFSWSYNSQDGTQSNVGGGGVIRPVVWPSGPGSPLQVTVMVGGDPWVFYKQASPAAMPTDAQFIQWAHDRGVFGSPAGTPTVYALPSSDGTKFYVEYSFQVSSGSAATSTTQSSATTSTTSTTPTSGTTTTAPTSGTTQPSLSTTGTLPPKIYRAVLYEDAAIWIQGNPAILGSTIASHFTNRWGDAVTVTESGFFNGWYGAPSQIVISNDNRTAHTITMAVSGTVNSYVQAPNGTGGTGTNWLLIPDAVISVTNTLKGSDGVALPFTQVSGAVYAKERMSGNTGINIYDEGAFPAAITLQPQDGGASVTTAFGWTQIPQSTGPARVAAPLLSVNLPSGAAEAFTSGSNGSLYAANRSVYWDETTGYWIGINPPPNFYNPDPNSDVTMDVPIAVAQVSITGAGLGKCIKFIRTFPSIKPVAPYVSAAMPHTTVVLTYGTANPGDSDAFRGVRFTHPSSWTTMVGDTSPTAYLFATSAVLAEEKLHGTGSPTLDIHLQFGPLPAVTVDQVTIYDGWTLKSWANPSGTLSTSNGIPVTAVALRSRTWTPATGLLGPLPDKTTIAGSPDAWGPTTTDEYTSAACSTPPAVDGTDVGLWNDAITAPSYATHRQGHITRHWDASGAPLMRLLTDTDHKTFDEVSGTKLRFSAPGSAAPPTVEALTADFGTTTYGYDTQGRITSQAGQRGSYTATETRAYTITSASGKPQPLVSDTVKTLTGPSGNIPANPNASVTVGTTTTYADPLVQSGPSTVLDKVDGRTETFAYDGLGRVTSHTDVLGIITTTTYDAWGHVKSVIRAAKGGVAQMETDYDFDPAGAWKSETVKEGDSGRSLATRTDMDAFGQVVKVTGPDGSYQTFDYTGFGEKNTASPVLKPGQTSWGNESWAFDAIGRETDHWDAQGRLLQHVVQQPAWGSAGGVTGIVTTTQDDRGYTRSEVHDLLGQKAAVVDQGNNTSQYWYDKDGHLLETQQGSQFRSYTYNDMGWLTSRTETEEGQTLYANFNMLGTPLLTTQKGRSGARTNTFTTTLDAHLQPISITATGPEGTVTRTLTYDGTTHLLTGVSESQANGTLTESYPIATAYDGLYRLIGKTISDGTQAFSVSQTLDAAGRQQSLTYPNAAGRTDQTVTGYDSLGRPATVKLNGEAIPSGSMVYDQISGTAVTDTLTFGNNAWTTSKVDKGELTHVTHTAAAGVLEDDAVTWTAGGLMLSRGPSANPDRWTYDPLQRLASATVVNPQDGSTVTQAFTYDTWGNRASTTTTYGGAAPLNREGLTWTASYDGRNDLPTTVSSLTTGVLYDDLGRMTQVWTTPGQSSTLTTWAYDPSGRVMKENGTSYLLDSAGLRFKRTKADGSITYTVYGFGREPLKVLTKAPAGTLAWSKTMVYGFGQLIREDDAVQGTTYDQSDQVGSPNWITNASGAVVGRAKTLPFGEQLYQWGDKSIRRYTNHEQDSDSNAIYMQAREYLPAYGKFAQVDPAYDQQKDDPESWNLYNYVTNNPVTHTDPDGRMSITPNYNVGLELGKAATDCGWVAMASFVFEPLKDTIQSELWMARMASMVTHPAVATASLPGVGSNPTGGGNGAVHTETPSVNIVVVGNGAGGSSSSVDNLPDANEEQKRAASEPVVGQNAAISFIVGKDGDENTCVNKAINDGNQEYHRLLSQGTLYGNIEYGFAINKIESSVTRKLAEGSTETSVEISIQRGLIVNGSHIGMRGSSDQWGFAYGYSGIQVAQAHFHPPHGGSADISEKDRDTARQLFRINRNIQSFMINPAGRVIPYRATESGRITNDWSF